MLNKREQNVEFSFKTSFKIWSAFLFLMNAFFGIAASYAKLFPHLWSIQTLGYFSFENLCDFMESYVEGVLNRIIDRHNREINVSHVACDLDTPGKPNLGCKFKISSVGEAT